MYVNDLPKSSLVLFADNPQLFVAFLTPIDNTKSPKDVKELQKGIDALLCWSKQ